MAEQRANYLALTEQRSGRSLMIVRLEAERAFNSHYSGGKYAGYVTSCFFEPPGFGDGNYACIGLRSYQNGNRVCSVATDWASSHETDYQAVDIVEGTGLKNGRNLFDRLCIDGRALSLGLSGRRNRSRCALEQESKGRYRLARPAEYRMEPPSSTS